MRLTRRVSGEVLKANNPVKASEDATGRCGRYRWLKADSHSRDMGKRKLPERRVVLAQMQTVCACATPRPSKNERPTDGQHANEMHQLASMQAITGTNHAALSSYGRKMLQLADATFQGLVSGGLNVAEQPGGSAASRHLCLETHSVLAYVSRRPDAKPFRLDLGHD
jgi:hypothetical protein